MTTLADLIAESRHHLMSGQSDRLNILASDIDITTLTIPLAFAAQGIRDGTILGIDLEEFYVLSTSGNAATVIPGFNGSTRADHLEGSIIRINPKFSDFRISKYINRALQDLSADGLFQIKQLEFPFIPSQANYSLDAPDLIDIWRVRYDVPGPSQYWPIVNKADWDLDQDASTTDFSGNKSLLLQRGGYPGHTVRVSYKAGFAPLTSTLENVLTISGLHTEAHKLPPLGAAIYLLSGREIKRTFMERQPEPRRQEEVPVGGASQAIRPIIQEYMDGLKRERRRLHRRYPDSL